jgi:hypothetical protein
MYDAVVCVEMSVNLAQRRAGGQAGGPKLAREHELPPMASRNIPAQGLIVLLLRGLAARRQHLLQVLVLETANALVLSDGAVGEQRVVPNVRSVGVAVLVDRPLPLCCVGVPRAHILHLQVLLLAVHCLGIGRHGCRRRRLTARALSKGGTRVEEDDEGATAADSSYALTQITPHTLSRFSGADHHETIRKVLMVFDLARHNERVRVQQCAGRGEMVR